MSSDIPIDLLADMIEAAMDEETLEITEEGDNVRVKGWFKV